jgi:two-component system, chemotaxis family, protein-glutamate methylesterase/glutaminase
MESMLYEAVVIGVSAGGLAALTRLLGVLPVNYPVPIVVVQHRSRDERFLLEEVLQTKCRIRIRQVEEKEAMKAGSVYFAPPDYHLLIEADHSFSLSYDAPVNYSRPSIDVLFETAAQVFGPKLAAIILTGANADGSRGIKMVRKNGGTTIAQEPATAEYPDMPQAAINTGYVQKIMDLDAIGKFLLVLPKK